MTTLAVTCITTAVKQSDVRHLVDPSHASRKALSYSTDAIQDTEYKGGLAFHGTKLLTLPFLPSSPSPHLSRRHAAVVHVRDWSQDSDRLALNRYRAVLPLVIIRSRKRRGKPSIEVR